MKRPDPKVERVSPKAADPDNAHTEPYTLVGDDPSTSTEVMGEDPEAKTLELAAAAGVVWEDTGDIQAFQKAAAAAHAALAEREPPPRPTPNLWTGVLGLAQIVFASLLMTGGMALLLFLTRGASGQP